MKMEMSRESLRFFLFVPVVLAALSLPASADLIAKLPQVMNPFYMIIAEGRLFVVEDSCTVHIFKLGDQGVSFVKTIGREGQGPGEFEFIYSVRVRNGILEAIASEKIARYTLDGEYIDEMKIPVPVFKGGLDRVGGHFLVGNYAFDPPSTTRTIRLYDADFKLIKEIGTWTDPLGFQKINPADDFRGFRVIGDRIFVIESGKETKITVRDAGGNVLREFRLPLQFLKMTNALKEAILEALKELYGSGWSRVEKMIGFSDYAPGLDWIGVADGMLVARTYRYRGDEVEFVFFDLNGKEIKRMFLPFTGRPAKGILFCVSQGRFYYLKMNEDDVYELHTVKIR